MYRPSFTPPRPQAARGCPSRSTCQFGIDQQPRSGPDLAQEQRFAPAGVAHDHVRRIVVPVAQCAGTARRHPAAFCHLRIGAAQPLHLDVPGPCVFERPHRGWALVRLACQGQHLVAARRQRRRQMRKLARKILVNEKHLHCLIRLSTGEDDLEGNNGNDLIGAGAGDDDVDGGDGNDIIYGAAGADEIDAAGDGDADLVFGGAGDDTIWAGAGDVVWGGAGDDEMSDDDDDGAIVFGFIAGSGVDTIYGFDGANTSSNDDTDVLDLSAYGLEGEFADLVDDGTITNDNNGTFWTWDDSVDIDLGGGNSIRLENVSLFELDDANFIL